MFDVLLTLDLRHALLLGHVFGLILGFGVAMGIDFLLLRSLLSKRTSPIVLDIAMQSSKLTTMGLCILWLTGLGFLAYYQVFSPEKLLNTKIYAKVIIVGLLSVNGWVIHTVMFPLLWKYSGKCVIACITYKELAMASTVGAVSFVSWVFPMIFGLNPALNFNYSVFELIGQYFGALAICCSASCLIAFKLKQHTSHRLSFNSLVFVQNNAQTLSSYNH